MKTVPPTRKTIIQHHTKEIVDFPSPHPSQCGYLLNSLLSSRLARRTADSYRKDKRQNFSHLSLSPKMGIFPTFFFLCFAKSSWEWSLESTSTGRPISVITCYVDSSARHTLCIDLQRPDDTTHCVALNAVSHRRFNVSCYRSASRYPKDHHNRLRVEEKCKNQRLTFGIALWRTMHKRITVLPPPPLLHSLCQWPLRYVVVCVGSCSDHLTRGVQMQFKWFKRSYSAVHRKVSTIGFSEFKQLFSWCSCHQTACLFFGPSRLWKIRFRIAACRPHLFWWTMACGRNPSVTIVDRNGTTIVFATFWMTPNERECRCVAFSARNAVSLCKLRCLPIGLTAGSLHFRSRKIQQAKMYSRVDIERRVFATLFPKAR